VEIVKNKKIMKNKSSDNMVKICYICNNKFTFGKEMYCKYTNVLKTFNICNNCLKLYGDDIEDLIFSVYIQKNKKN
jgi:hypothetical protein